MVGGEIIETNGDFIKKSLERQQPVTGEPSEEVIWSNKALKADENPEQVDIFSYFEFMDRISVLSLSTMNSIEGHSILALHPDLAAKVEKFAELSAEIYQDAGQLFSDQLDKE